MKQLLALSLVLAMSGIASASVVTPALSDSREQEKKDQHDKKDQEDKKDQQDKKDQHGKKEPDCDKAWWQCQDDKKGDQDQKKDDQDQKKDDQDGKKQDDDGKWDPQSDKSDFMRVDCRYHNVEKIRGINHCYASAIYIPGEEGDGYRHVQLGVGCDFQTIYNDTGRVQVEQVGERISPPTAAFPGLEIFPHNALRNTGTYESVLDIRAGRLAGTCYVHSLKEKDHHRDSSWAWEFSPLK